MDGAERGPKLSANLAYLSCSTEARPKQSTTQMDEPLRIHGFVRAVYPERNDSSIMTLSILMRWVVTQTNRIIPSMTRYAATTRSRRCPRESEPLACLKFESKQRVIFPLATVAMAY